MRSEPPSPACPRCGAERSWGLLGYFCARCARAIAASVGSPFPKREPQW